MRDDIFEQGQAIRAATQALAQNAPDEVVAAQPLALYDEWSTGSTYAYNQPIIHGGQLYRVALPGGVTAIESQPPGGEGMLAVYRPIDAEHAGTQEDPIPWVYGMDCYNGKYYTHNDKTYLCTGDMIPCVWEPGAPGVNKWEEVTE